MFTVYFGELFVVCVVFLEIMWKSTFSLTSFGCWMPAYCILHEATARVAWLLGVKILWNLLMYKLMLLLKVKKGTNHYLQKNMIFGENNYAHKKFASNYTHTQKYNMTAYYKY